MCKNSARNLGVRRKLILRGFFIGLFLSTAVSLSSASEDYIPPVGEKKSLGTGLGKTIDLFFNAQGVKAAVKKSGLRGNSAGQVENFLKLSLQSLGGSDRPSKSQVLLGLKTITAGEDGNIKRELLNIFSKKESELTKGDFVLAVNHLVYLAGRYGVNSTLALSCGACVSGVLSQNGFKFSFNRLKDDKIEYVVKNVLPKNPRELNQFISDRLQRLGLGKMNREASSVLDKGDEKNFAIFLALEQHGSTTHKELISAIKSLSTDSYGNTLVLNPENPHRLWRLFVSDLSEEKMESWSRALKIISADANQAGEVNKKDAFFRFFAKKARENPELADRYEVLKKKSCFFN